MKPGIGNWVSRMGYVNFVDLQYILQEISFYFSFFLLFIFDFIMFRPLKETREFRSKILLSFRLRGERSREEIYSTWMEFQSRLFSKQEFMFSMRTVNLI